jgi:tetratricopeptide (TPR) repeat protein
VFYTGQSYQDSGMYEDAIKWYRLYTKLNNVWIEEKFESHMRIAFCMMKLNYNLIDIETEMASAIKLEDDRAEPHFHIGKYCNEIGEFEKGYSYLKTAKSKNINHVKEKYVLFIQEKMYGDYINDELSVSCFWTKRFKEGYQYLLGILNDNRFENEKERLLTNQKHFQDNLGIEHD